MQRFTIYVHEDEITKVRGNVQTRCIVRNHHRNLIDPSPQSLPELNTVHIFCSRFRTFAKQLGREQSPSLIGDSMQEDAFWGRVSILSERSALAPNSSDVT